MDQQEQISKLTLLLLYLTSWKEEEAQRSWKGYDFDTLNKLQEDGLIAQSKTAKSVYLTEEGIDAAKKLQERLTI